MTKLISGGYASRIRWRTLRCHWWGCTPRRIPTSLRILPSGGPLVLLKIASRIIQRQSELIKLEYSKLIQIASPTWLLFANALLYAFFRTNFAICLLHKINQITYNEENLTFIIAIIRIVLVLFSFYLSWSDFIIKIKKSAPMSNRIISVATLQCGLRSSYTST